LYVLLASHLSKSFMNESAVSSTVTHRRCPVLIAGGGPVGLALAIDLGWRGISCILVEQSDGAVGFPTTNLVNTRTCEHLRRWGIVDQVKRAGFPTDFPRNYIFVTRVFGHELARFEHPANGDPQFRSPYSPEGRIWCPKLFFDPVLQQHAKSLHSVQVRFNTRLESFSQDANRVVAEVFDIAHQRRQQISADYLIACDGGASPTRRQLGIRMEGNFVEGQNVAILFRSPVVLGNNHGKAVMYQVSNQKVLGTVAAVDGRELWRVNLRNIRPDQLPSLDVGQLVRDSLGSDFPFEILSVQPWDAHRVVAQRYSRGRVFLAGDAAHLLWPTGGFGMNTGVGDSVDLGWKLAATIEGWGGPRLLDSYEPERRPIGIRNVNEAADMRADFDTQIPTSPFLDEDSEEGNRLREQARDAILRTRAKEFQYDSAGVELGYRYENSPICVADGSLPPPEDHATYTPTTWPGARAPHVWLQDGRSTLDLFGRGFVLLVLSSRVADVAPLTSAAKRVGLPFEVIKLDEPRVREAYDKSLVLVRPDGHVAWRGESLPNNPEEIIDRVRGAA
jgi:2-polyprenyl-6-methoxyphenol hydroxylase-like FAD-dependent oxidoreductase